jgi:hypothetical protein
VYQFDTRFFILAQSSKENFMQIAIKTLCFCCCCCLFLVCCKTKESEPLINAHPLEFYELAGEKYKEGKKDEAAILFYIGKIRFRYYLESDTSKLARDQAVVFHALNSVLGNEINLYLGGNPKNWCRVIDSAMVWENNHDNLFTPKDINPKAYSKIIQGLSDLKKYVKDSSEQILRQRKLNGIQDSL